VATPIKKEMEIAHKKDLDQLISKLLAEQKEEIIRNLESNPNEDGSISPNIQHWIERKQAQLRNHD
jgi:uncharacterized protein (DUF2336 family)